MTTPDRTEHVTVAGREPVDRPARAVGRRYADLEGYRGIAALAIVVFHVVQYAEAGRDAVGPAGHGPTSVVLLGLDAFVDLFFVLSAFLLTLPYARSALRGEPSPSGRAFVLRRAARIVPLYVVAITVVWATRNPVFPGDWRDLLEHLTFTHVFDQQRIFYTIGPAWSLAVEVQFYLVLALLGAALTRVCARIGHRARVATVLGAIGLLVALSVAWKAVAWYVLEVPGDVWPVWFGLPAKLDVFAVGMLLAVVAAAGWVRVGRLGVIVLRLAALAVLAWAFATRPYGQGEHVWFDLYAAVGFGLLLAGSVLGPQDWWVRALAARVPAFLGLVSYSLYMWHEPLLLWLADAGWLPPQEDPTTVLVGLLVLVPVSLVVAWLSYLVIERPAANLRVLLDDRGRPRDYYDGS